MADDREKERDTCLVQGVRQELLDTLPSLARSAEELAQAAELFKILSDPTRMRIVDALLAAELCVCEIAEFVDMTQSAVSHQLRILRAARLVRYRKEGKNVFYSLDDAHVRTLITQALDHIGHRGDV